MTADLFPDLDLSMDADADFTGIHCIDKKKRLQEQT